ncbi:PQQ-dependent sugar dehydrogenase [Xinfangfangia sp. D13-10-4-6]|nr:PQQ-dependent sugar dehydrogenase [Pseudogemmobacter hezensis]
MAGKRKIFAAAALAVLPAALGPQSALAEGVAEGVAGDVAAGRIDTSAGVMVVEKVAEGLDGPWGFAFLPDGSILITERKGHMWRAMPVPGALADKQPVTHLPEVVALGQGGLLDVMVPADHAQSGLVWMTWSAPSDDGPRTMLGHGLFDEASNHFSIITSVFGGESMVATRHYGSRIVENPGDKGRVFVTLGDRGTGPAGLEAQDPRLTVGKVVYIEADGRPAISQDGAEPGVYSIGHRNIQGAALREDGALLISEHGAKGGDEINLIRPGANYGWPVISYGVNYNGTKIGSGTHQDGMEQPLHYWDPSIAPSGLMIYSGALVPEWKGDVFAGSLNSDFISRLDPDTPAATGWAEERIASDATGRVRDVREGPDGAIWFLSETEGALYRMRPAGDGLAE